MAILPGCLPGDTGSIPVWAAHGAFSLTGKIPDCGSGVRGFDSPKAPKFIDSGKITVAVCLLWMQEVAGSPDSYRDCFPDKMEVRKMLY